MKEANLKRPHIGLHYMTFLNKQNYGFSKIKFKNQWFPGVGGRGMNRQSTDFQDREATLHDAIIVDTCHYICVQTCRMHSTKSEPPCKLWTSGDGEVSA